jgi:hypothetical protein
MATTDVTARRSCRYCGKMLPPLVEGQGGRPKSFCNSSCRAMGSQTKDMPADMIERIMDMHYRRIKQRRG